MLELLTQGIVIVWSIWSSAVFLVQIIGNTQIFRYFSSPPRRAAVESLPDHAIPHITVIRPVKGLEPALYECLASTFQVSYPKTRLSVHLCVEDRDDPSFPVLERVVADFPDVDARIYVEVEDPILHGADGDVRNLGPNPKIRNISRAYREARGDVVWIIDCNVWVSRGVAGRMVDKLFGYRETKDGVLVGQAKPFKFVHQLPLVVDVTDMENVSRGGGGGGSGGGSGTSTPTHENQQRSFADIGGARLDEMFMATTHAKFYSAINTVSIAPCIVGKSNMFRKSHLDRVTDPAENPTVLKAADGNRGRGIDFFSSYICEDHLIGDLLWRSPIPGYRNHGLVTGDLAIQPMADTTVAAYFARRVRWLRVRKWTVLLATLVEPGVESLLCCFYASFALTSLSGQLPLPALLTWFIQPTWGSTLRCWLTGVFLWMVADWFTYHKLQACQSVEVDEDTTPVFARGRAAGNELKGGMVPRPFLEWLQAWVGREVLALPIWTWAVLLGTTVSWRGKQFRVRINMSVVEIDSKGKIVAPKAAPLAKKGNNGVAKPASSSSKARLD